LKKALKIIVFVFVFLGIGGVLTHCSFKRYTTKSFKVASAEKPYDVVIVPGIPFEPGKENDVMKMRLYWAHYLYTNGFTENIIFSGSAVYTPYVESIVMKVMADSLQIPTSKTFSETTAEHSTENVYYSMKMAKAMGFTKIALATDPFQSRMLESFMNKYCPDVTAIPIVLDSLAIAEKVLPLIDSRSAFVDNFVSIKERQGFWERWKGTRGKRVTDELKESNGTLP
jgi:uncharacterized SAM-binding protein YcdF (DUF218 family)